MTPEGSENAFCTTKVQSLPSVKSVRVVVPTSDACLPAIWCSPQSLLSKAHYSKITALILRKRSPSRTETASPQQCGFHLYPQWQTRLVFLPCILNFYQCLAHCVAPVLLWKTHWQHRWHLKHRTSASTLKVLIFYISLCSSFESECIKKTKTQIILRLLSYNFNSILNGFFWLMAVFSLN